MWLCILFGIFEKHLKTHIFSRYTFRTSKIHSPMQCFSQMPNSAGGSSMFALWAIILNVIVACFCIYGLAVVILVLFTPCMQVILIAVAFIGFVRDRGHLSEGESPTTSQGHRGKSTVCTKKSFFNLLYSCHFMTAQPNAFRPQQKKGWNFAN